MPRIDAVVTHHRDGFRSGVARFNELLAAQLEVPLIGLTDSPSVEPSHPLLSFKVSELGDEERSAVAALLERSDGGWDIFLHEFTGLEPESRLIARARRVYAGNHEIAARLGRTHPDVEIAWAPGLILDDRVFVPAEISVFSFGMAHKLHLDMFRKLRTLLDATGRSYVVYVSTANHETASLHDSESIFKELHDVFPRELFFLGNLSDVAVFNYLRGTTFFAAFFPEGVRANNTSVASAMERGAVVVTNLDRHSPPEFVHMENVIDLERCGELPSDPLTLAHLSVGAMGAGRVRSWDQLVERLSR